MSNDDIENILKVEIENSHNYKGKKEAILNIDNNGGGTHWVEISKKLPHVYYYNDSYGVEPDLKGLGKGNLIIYNPYQIQGYNEENCGARSIVGIAKSRLGIGYNENVQSILFDKTIYSIDEAIKWLDSHSFIHPKVHETDNYYRFRQFNPSKNKYHYTTTHKKGIKFIIER